MNPIDVRRLDKEARIGKIVEYLLRINKGGNSIPSAASKTGVAFSTLRSWWVSGAVQSGDIMGKPVFIVDLAKIKPPRRRRWKSQPVKVATNPFEIDQTTTGTTRNPNKSPVSHGERPRGPKRVSEAKTQPNKEANP